MDIKNKRDYDLIVTYVSLSGATKPPKSDDDDIWKGWNPPMNRVMPPQGKNGEHLEWRRGEMKALLDALHQVS